VNPGAGLQPDLLLWTRRQLRDALTKECWDELLEIYKATTTIFITPTSMRAVFWVVVMSHRPAPGLPTGGRTLMKSPEPSASSASCEMLRHEPTAAGREGCCPVTTDQTPGTPVAGRPSPK
jgi:hypothetical protein